MKSPDTLAKLANGNFKVICYTNAAASNWNARIRASIFGEKEARENLFLTGDNLVCTSPINGFDRLDIMTEGDLFKYVDKTSDFILRSNSKFKVLQVATCKVTLIPKIVIDCYKLLVDYDGDKHTVYAPKDSKQFEAMLHHYDCRAWAIADKKQRTLMYKKKNFIRNCFASLVHAYALTSYRVQGATIPEVLVDYATIKRVTDVTVRNMAINVAVGRTRDRLYFYRG
jgi:hypothetical protein